MTAVNERPLTGERRAERYRPRKYLMCPPEFFGVEYTINPWMHPDRAVDRSRALTQWEALVALYRELGHTVQIIDPAPGLPDMVYTANGATCIDRRVLGVRFAHSQRRGEEARFERWYREHAEELGISAITAPRAVNEGEGDFLVAGDLVLAGYGFRTDPRSHAELAEAVARPVVPLRLVSPWHYHLDTALAVLDSAPDRPDIAWFPAAFSPASRAIIERLFPDALQVGPADARGFGLNMTSDGEHVIFPATAPGLEPLLRERGYQPLPIGFDELLKGGGSVKCCTQTLPT